MEDIASCAVANPTGHFHCNELHVNNLSDCNRTAGKISGYNKGILPII